MTESIIQPESFPKDFCMFVTILEHILPEKTWKGFSLKFKLLLVFFINLSYYFRTSEFGHGDHDT